MATEASITQGTEVYRHHIQSGSLTFHFESIGFCI